MEISLWQIFKCDGKRKNGKIATDSKGSGKGF